MGEISLPLARHNKKKIRTNKSAKPTESYIIQCTARFAISPQLLLYEKDSVLGRWYSSQPPNDDDQHDEMSAGANYTLFGAACWESTIEARTITSSNDRKYFQKEKLPDFN